MGEILDDVFPCLKGVAAKFQQCGHRVTFFLFADEVISIEQVTSPSDNSVMSGRYSDVFLQPGEGSGFVLCNEIHLIVLNEHPDGLLHR